VQGRWGSGVGVVHLPAVAPPKRKTGGRVTPSGTRPGDRPVGSTSAPTKTSASAAASGSARTTRATTGGVGASSRYTPPVPKSAQESPPWVPILMLALFVVGGLAIMARYLIWDSSNIPMLVGLACILGGLYTATKWR